MNDILTARLSWKMELYSERNNHNKIEKLPLPRYRHSCKIMFQTSTSSRDNKDFETACTALDTAQN